MELHYEDALKFLVESLGRSPNAFSPGGVPPSYDVWIPRCVAQFLVASSVDTRGDPEFSHRSEFEKVWTAFYDAAWQLCRRGIFRLSQTRPEGMGTSYGPLGDGYAVTEAGREWLKTAQLRYFPSEPGRYVQVLQQPARVLGDGFLQRAGEAAGCHDFGNYLACCAMCGAAAESALLAIASQKTGDEDSVLKTYNKRDGRRNVAKMIFGSSGSSVLETRFQSGLNLLLYWRDEAAHGRFSTLSELEAYDALGRLLHLAFLAWDHWQDLTGNPRPADSAR